MHYFPKGISAGVQANSLFQVLNSVRYVHCYTTGAWDESIYLSILVYSYLSIYLSQSVHIYPSLFLSISVCSYLSIYLSICLHFSLPLQHLSSSLFGKLFGRFSRKLIRRDSFMDKANRTNFCLTKCALAHYFILLRVYYWKLTSKHITVCGTTQGL